MPYRSMSLEEFAKHVCMDARDLRKMAEDGELPAHKVAGKWRFHRAHVTEWLQQRMPTLAEDHLMALEKSLGSSGDRDAEEENAIVTGLIGVDGIDDHLPARTRDSVLRELVKLVERTDLLFDEGGLLEALEQREALCPTALPNGVAIPHPRQPMPYATAEPLICVGRVPSGIAYGAPNHSMTKLFFLICCHDDHEHLHVLARLMRILDDTIVQNLLDAESPVQLLETLIAKEEAVMKQLAAH
ncbi:MAG: PTS sugar transporter subunit IIA [Planctomycetes bacterium]|nr:PTS sugar transporter subunit IIA [Planctomycetota bacterium]